MTKEDHIKYWVTTSKNDWKRAESLLKLKDYDFALFCLHLSIEKLAKALWIKEHETDYPPRIHNLITLFSKTSFSANDDQLSLMNELNFFQMEGRYPEHAKKIHRIARAAYTKDLFVKTKELKLCALKMLR
jgi:HEPN domain-containing protein